MLKKIGLTVVGVFLGTLIISHQSYGQSTTSTTGQSTTSTTTQQTVTTPAKKARVSRPAAAPTVETTESTVTTTPATPRPIYDMATLKKMNKTLCAKGFDAKVGNDNKNVCSGKAAAPDLAYSCVWMKKGDAAYAPTEQGPCSLDNVEHRGSMVISKADYKSSPPLDYGTSVECCFRAAKGPDSVSSTSSTSTIPAKAK